MCLFSWIDVWHDERYGFKVLLCTTPIYACDLQVKVTDFNFCISFVFKFLKTLYCPNLLFSLVNMSNILFYFKFTPACDLEIKSRT